MSKKLSGPLFIVANIVIATLLVFTIIELRNLISAQEELVLEIYTPQDIIYVHGLEVSSESGDISESMYDLEHLRYFLTNLTVQGVKDCHNAMDFQDKVLSNNPYYEE